jgi:hypothetical protein
MRLALLALIGALAWPVGAHAQPAYDEYEARYGKPVDVSLMDLVNMPQAYRDKAIRTSGRLAFDTSAGGARYYVLEDSLTARVRLFPMPQIASNFESEALQMMGQQLEVTGLFYEGTSDGSSGAGIGNAPAGAIQFWSYLGPPEKEAKGPIKALETTLEALVSDPGRRDGQTVRVVGQFRGRNLFGDLPSRSQRNSRDWVIKDSLFAVWVTGRKPQGDGWRLDSGLKRDTGKWIEVVGRVGTRGGVTYLEAQRVSLAAAPSAAARVEPPPPPPERPQVPPVVVFALPVDGEASVPPDSRFQVQFSKDMDQATFAGRVVLRYTGPLRPGDRGFDAVKLSYDEGRRALTVDPGDLLRAGRELELLLLPGIADAEGLSLMPRDGQSPGGVVDVLRYQVGG